MTSPHSSEVAGHVGRTTGTAGSAGADARHCARIVGAHARTFALASRFLPPDKRRATFALYAFCRVVDDLVDQTEADDADGRAARAHAYHARLDAALAGRPDDAVFRELARAARRFRLPGGVLHDLVRGVERDLASVRYGSWAELVVYCGAVASTVGEMCTHVFGVRSDAGPPERALAHARTLGVAMQLTNILRDVGEDARRGRCYLPDDELERFRIDRGEVVDAAVASSRTGDAGMVRDGRWGAFMRFQTRRARRLYADAMPGIALLCPDAQRCAAACALGYAGILRAIERRRYDTITGRACLAAHDRLAVLWQSRQWPRAHELGGGTVATVSDADDVLARA